MDYDIELLVREQFNTITALQVLVAKLLGELNDLTHGHAGDVARDEIEFCTQAHQSLASAAVMAALESDSVNGRLVTAQLYPAPPASPDEDPEAILAELGFTVLEFDDQGNEVEDFDVADPDTILLEDKRDPDTILLGDFSSRDTNEGFSS